ncbi:MAG: phenylacetate--CoA ligase family protein [Burkholderiales bacterium]|nr:phenylacetate--CoA ligase family protein [Burkholderiales bacterium]
MSAPGTLAGVAWPRIAGQTRREQLLALLQQFAEAERWPAGLLQQHQLRQLALTVAHACRTVPFYRQRFGAAGYRAGDALTPERLRDLPLLTRRDIQDAGAALRSSAIPPQFGAVHENRTSGATGQPVQVVRTALDALIWQANTLRDHRWHRRDPSLKLAAIRALPPGDADPPLGVTAAGWGAASEALGSTGPAALLTLNADVAVQAAWLRRHAPGYLLTYPSNLAALLAHFARAGERLPGLRAVLTVGETVSAALRAACGETLGVGIEDVYSSQELGYIALQCPVSGQYHVMAESVLVEVLDAEGRPCAPGETGRLVISSLHNHATPLIRYELRDHAEVGGPCACGRTLPTLARIAGRSRNMVRLPDGSMHWPMVGFHRFREIAPVRQYQLVQRAPDAIEVRLACDRALGAAEEDQLGEVIRNALGHPFRLDFAYFEGELPRAPNGKFEEFVCAIPAD